MNTKRFLSLLLAMLLLVSLAACGGTDPAPGSAPTEKTHLLFADVGWDSIRFHNAVAGLVAEHVFGYTWEEVSGSTPISHEALIKGEIDVHMEVWTDNIASYDSDLAEGKFQELSLNFGDNIQGFYVPRYVIEGDPERGIEPIAPELRTVADLSEYAELFPDDNEPGKGVIYGGIPGWEIDSIMYAKYLYYGLDEMYNYVQPGSDAAMSATLVSAYDRGEPIVAYYWEPTWLLGKYDFVLLEDEPYDETIYRDGGCACPSVPVMVCVSNGFAGTNPGFCEFLAKYETSSALTSEGLAHMQETGDDYHATAVWFLQQHPEFIDGWLTAEQAATLREALN